MFYKAVGSDLKPAQLTFFPRINAAVVGKKTALNGASNPNGRELTYKIAGLADTDYSIEKTEAGINVTVNKTGSYTLRAESLEDGEYMALSNFSDSAVRLCSKGAHLLFRKESL